MAGSRFRSSGSRSLAHERQHGFQGAEPFRRRRQQGHVVGRALAVSEQCEGLERRDWNLFGDLGKRQTEFEERREISVLDGTVQCQIDVR